jgi:hypothetical protein
MTTPLPIACTLDAAALRDRRAELEAIGAEGLVAARFEGGGARLRFRPSVAERLEDVVAAERECCAWLGLDLSRADGELELTLTAPPDAEPALREFAAAFDAR